MARQSTISPTVPTKPQFETRSKVPLAGGLVPGIDNSMWLWRSVPLSSITNAKTAKEAVEGGRGLHHAFEELSELAKVGLNRSGSKASYREFQVLGLSVPSFYKAPETSTIKDYLNTEFRDRLILRRELVFGVKLIPSALGSVSKGASALQAIKGAANSITHSIVYGGSLLSDYDRDVALVGGGLARAGLTVPSSETLHWVDSWYNRGGAKGIPILPHDEHIHFFHSMEAKRYVDKHLDIESCEHWPEEGIPGEEAITFAALNGFTISPTDVENELVRWASELMENHARVISVRGLVEPQQITRKVLASQKQKYTSDIAEFHAKNKTPKAEQEEQEAAIAQMEAGYGLGQAPATLHDCSIVIGFDGVVEDLRRVTPRSMDLGPMINLQPAAWYETMICSSVRANPLKQDLPATMVAYSGIQNIARVGDPDGALMGFMESGSQPVYVSNRAASAGDAFPLMLCAAGTGSGKTMLLQWLAHQWGEMRIPQVIVDPKRDSDLAPAVQASGGRVYSFDEFVHSDGALDPLRFSADPNVGAALAADMISRVRPWTHYQTQQHETDISFAIQHGVSQGARATGQALRIAERDGVIDPEIVATIFKLADSYPMFRATFGINPEGQPLTASEGISLFKVGKSQFELPAVGSLFDPATASPLVRMSVNLLRMIVRASMSTLSGRAGVLHFDEGWVLQQAAPDELEQIGRLARSQDVLPIIYTQTPSGALAAGMKNFTSRGAIGHILDEHEAIAGMQLFGAESEDLVTRVTRKEFLSGGSGVDWQSLKALWDIDDLGTRHLARPAVFFHSDLKNQLAPVEVHIPPSFFKLASTSPEDIAKRDKLLDIRHQLVGAPA